MDGTTAGDQDQINKEIQDFWSNQYKSSYSEEHAVSFKKKNKVLVRP